MRRLRRPQHTPPTLARQGLGGQQRLSDCQRYELDSLVPGSFAPHWLQPDVIGLLHAMQGRICAYCCSACGGLEVEHFRPKGPINEDKGHGGYWWLAYDFSNYFLGCGVCNRRKGTRFPLVLGAVRCRYDNRDAIITEERVLLDPGEDTIEEWLTIGVNDVNAKLTPNPSLTAGDQSRVQDTIDILGLNLDPMVRTQRSKAYEEAARAAFEERWDKLRLAAMRHRPHSLVARIVLQRVAPEHLPGITEEINDLANLLWNDLRTIICELGDLEARGKPTSNIDKRRLKALVWALAALVNDLPDGDVESADTYMERLLKAEEPSIRDQIISLFRIHGHSQERQS